LWQFVVERLFFGGYKPLNRGPSFLLKTFVPHVLPKCVNHRGKNYRNKQERFRVLEGRAKTVRKGGEREAHVMRLKPVAMLARAWRIGVRGKKTEFREREIDREERGRGRERER
jgi:hypothetical protein